jgi:hypothetical protein
MSLGARVVCCGLLAGLLGGSVSARAGRAQGLGEFVAVGVVYRPDPDAERRQQAFEDMLRFRFNVVSLVHEDSTSAAPEIALLDALVAGAPAARIRVTDVGTVSVTSTTSRSGLRHAAWALMANGARGVIFADWPTLQSNADALQAAADFADTITRNAALYAPLRPRAPKGGASDVTFEGDGDHIQASFLESADALLLIALNRSSEPRTVTMTFSPGIPEAIWQNMLSGGAVNFVAGPSGPTYTRTFAPHDVLVLMIKKQWR